MEAGPSASFQRVIHTPVSSSTPNIPSDALPAETPWTGELNPSETKWFKTVQKPGRRSHPYTLAAVSLQQAHERFIATECRFFPWVGPWKPGRAEGNPHWDKIEGLVLIAAKKGIIIGRCTDETPWKVEWTLEFTEHSIQCVAWSFDVFTLHPLAICAGAQGFVYVVDIVDKTVIKTFRGHGGEILSLSVCQAMPHIVASTSTDLTIRIWNIHGAPRPAPPPGEEYSENYGMGDADEGTECVAILAGRGHMDKVATCAFHPRHAALVTGGGDHLIKIWALPPLPKATRRGVTPRGYRPTVVYFPIFSTARMHDEFVDWVDWISDDVLVSRGATKLVTWLWTGYKRFFHPLRFEPMSRHAQISDWDDSHSWAECIRYVIHKGDSYNYWYIHPGLHRAFQPTPEELDSHPNLVTSCLFAMPANSTRPVVHLFNPSLAEPYGPPDIFTKLRPLDDTEPWKEYDELVAEAEAAIAAQARDKALRLKEKTIERENARKRARTSRQSARFREMSEEAQAEAELESLDFEETEVESDGYEVIEEKRVIRETRDPQILVPESLEDEPAISSSKASDLVTHAARITIANPASPIHEQTTGPVRRSQVSRRRQSRKDTARERERGAASSDIGPSPSAPVDAQTKKSDSAALEYPSLAPWVLKIDNWRTFEKTSKVALKLRAEEMLVQGLAIQPRGARFIVGVGDFQSIFVWKLK